MRTVGYRHAPPRAHGQPVTEARWAVAGPDSILSATETGSGRDPGIPGHSKVSA
jgi:hypothetical protein